VKVPLEWLREYVNIQAGVEELAECLTMSGIAVEGWEEVEGDAVLTLELTPNRGDCYGMINVAREVAAVFGCQIRLPQVSLKESPAKVEEHARVDIQDEDLCPRYAARVVSNVDIKPSPSWMQRRLIQAGIRPINNIVDITNYVMLETNQPLHAFDYDLLAGGRIIVRRACPGEQLVTLDGVLRTLDRDMLVIADADKAVALAGIMGGQETEVTEKTTTILLESANFSAPSIRKTSRRLGLRTEASIRFEKGADAEGVVWAVDRAAQLIEVLGAGEVLRGVCDVYPGKTEQRAIRLRPARVNHLLGTELSRDQIKGYLARLGFSITAENGVLVVEVPSYRPDLQVEADLIEEIARLHGYNNIPSTLPQGAITQGIRTPFQRFKDATIEVLSRYLCQVMNYSFINPGWFDLMRLDERHYWRNTVKLANPLSEEQSVMRTTLIPGMLDTVRRNLFRQNEDLALFEVGTVFIPRPGSLPIEELKVCAATTGKTEMHWSGMRLDMDYFFLKGIADRFLFLMGVNGCSYEGVSDHPSFHPGRTAKVVKGQAELGIIGEIHPEVLSNYDIKRRVCVFEFDLKAIFELAESRKMTDDITRFPAVQRDLALLIPEQTPAATVTSMIKSAGGELLRQAVLFDVYQGPQVPEGYKSLGYSLVFQSYERTLQEEEINLLIDGILRKVEHRAGGKLR